MWGTAQYYYRGNQNSWGATKMSESTDGFYEYILSKGHNTTDANNNFKIAKSTSGWDYGNNFYTTGFNGTDITNAGNWDSDNICVYNATDFYILVYKPNTSVNSSANPVVCFSSCLPDNRTLQVYYVNTNSWASVKAFGWYRQNDVDGASNGWPGKAMTNTGKTNNGKAIWTYTYPQSYEMAIFNDGGSNQTSDLTMGRTNAGKMYNGTAWVAYAFDVTFNKQSGSGGTSSVIATVGLAMPEIELPTREGYTFGGYFTAAEGGGTKYYNADGSSAVTLAANGASTLFAKWTENKFDVTVNKEGEGTITPSGAQSNVGQVAGLAITAEAAENYEFANWEIVSGTGSFESATTTASNKFFPTSDATIRANFHSTATISLTVSAGSNVSTVTGSVDPVTLDTKYDIAATAFATGYEFANWIAEPAANAVFDDADAASTKVTVKNGSVVVTANAQEKLSALTASNHYDAGNPAYAAPTVGSASIGIATTSTLTAATPSTGYTFGGWTLSDNLVVTSGDKTKDLSITVRTNGDGAAATAVANYEEDLSTAWVVRGGAQFGNTWTINTNAMLKKSGHSTESVAYFTVSITGTNTGSSNDAYKFKIYNPNTEKWYGLPAEGNEYWFLRSTTEQTMSDAKNIELRADIAGDYEIKVDYTTPASPKITVTFPCAYTITWKDGNGETLKTELLACGSTPEYDGETPTKTATAQYTYAFNDTWSPAIAAVSADATYTAQFDATVNEYTITWLNDDDSMIDQTVVEYGDVPIHGVPEKEADAQYTYTFDTWSPAVVAVTGDATYKAVYTATLRTYKVTFAAGANGSVDLSAIENVPYGAEVTVNGNKLTIGTNDVTATPAAQTAEYTYAFVEWTNAPATITGATTITATFSATKRSYTIKFMNGEVELQSSLFEYGATPAYAGATPTKTATAEFSYEFKGWDAEIVAVTGEATYNATFTATKRSYTITWLNDDNSQIDQTVVEYGEVPVHGVPTKEATAQYTYTFDKWSPSVDYVTGPATYKAVYTSTVRKYTVSIVNDSVGYGDVSATEIADVPYGTLFVIENETPNVLNIGELATITATPAESTSKYKYEFKAWVNVPTSVEGDVTIHVGFTRTDLSPATALDDVNEGGVKVEKFMRDNKIYIRVNGRVYDASGRLVE